ncbi:MAG: fused MFS/spermidine synthase [Candidatus Omnitrophota bacterium]
MKKRFIASFLVIGASGITAQVILLREFLIRFSGNELSIGIILANWLLLEAAGAYLLGRKIEYIDNKIHAFVICQIMFCLFLAAEIYITRTLNTILQLTPGEGFGIIFIFCSSMLILLPVCFLHGALFVFGCSIYSTYAKSGRDPKSIATVYICDAIGILIGGVVFTYLFIRYFNSFQIAFFICLLNISMALILLGAFLKDKQPPLTKVIACIACAFLLINIFLFIKSDDIHMYSIKKQWSSGKIAFYRNSIYGNVVVTEKNNEHTFFINNTPAFTSPAPNITFIEEFAHLALLSHPSPFDILVLGNGAGGLISEILKHPVRKIEYCELDPLLINAAKKFLDPEMQKQLLDSRVKIINTDARLFLEKAKTKYDVIFIGVSNPQDLQTNRLFTEQFFRLVKEGLNEKGMVAITMPSSLTYLSYELRKLNGCIYDSLALSLDYVRAIPGESVIFIGSDSKETCFADTSLIIKRFQQRKIKTSFLTIPYVEDRLSRQWSSWYLDSIKGTKRKINDDFLPIGVFYSLSYWNALFSPNTQKAFRLLEGANLWFFIIPLFVSLPFFKKRAVCFAVATSGFCAMAATVVLIFAFQILHGYIYHWIGLLISAIMSGVALSAYIMRSNLEKQKDPIRLLMKLESAIVAFALILAFALPRLSLNIAFLAFCFAQGALVGAEFPLANRIYVKTSKSVSQSAGVLYAADLFGGWFGGLLAGVVLLPVLGLFQACLLMVILKISSLILLTKNSLPI